MKFSAQLYRVGLCVTIDSLFDLDFSSFVGLISAPFALMLMYNYDTASMICVNYILVGCANG